ncbi:unnamed protein product [Nesidiocoris tenuis]|uniref:Uncharacterized protein n=1 Tax=Nesidiocoris tenuis TaxID=355587 RepID=A0A6H5GJJ9_9HEMI|nr:unnamed protein product [Nesidiocoris tenuis]
MSQDGEAPAGRNKLKTAHQSKDWFLAVPSGGTSCSKSIDSRENKANFWVTSCSELFSEILNNQQSWSYLVKTGSQPGKESWPPAAQ